MSEIGIDLRRAEAIFSRLIKSYREKSQPYDRVILPQSPQNMPKTLLYGSASHALFLFCSCYFMRGSIKSDFVIRQLARIFDNYPELFVPKNFANGKVDSSYVSRTLEHNGFAYKADEVGHWWESNLVKLYRFWDGNPVNLFRNVSSYQDACNIMLIKSYHTNHSTGFMGFRSKLTSMLIYFLVDAGMIKSFLFPIPTDFHVFRILVSNRIIFEAQPNQNVNFYQSYKRSAPAMDAIRNIFTRYCERYNVEPVELDNALWILSRTLCRLNPGNRVSRLNRGSKIEFFPVPLNWTGSQIRAYNKSCAICPIENTCYYNVPFAPYHVAGKIIITGKREKPPLQIKLFEP